MTNSSWGDGEEEESFAIENIDFFSVHSSRRLHCWLWIWIICKFHFRERFQLIDFSYVREVYVCNWKHFLSQHKKTKKKFSECLPKKNQKLFSVISLPFRRAEIQTHTSNKGGENRNVICYFSNTLNVKY